MKVLDFLLFLATVCGLAQVAVAAGCGAVASTASTDPITAVIGTFNVPSTAAGAALDIQLSIDDDAGECGASVMVGLNIENTGGSAAYSVFYFWYPNYAHTFPDFTVNEGDELQVNITTTSASSAIVTVMDITTNASASETIAGNALCRAEALWEAYALGSTANLSNAFSNIIFQDSYALTSDGTSLGIGDATLTDEDGCNPQEVGGSELVLTATN